jgi:hypothetical protein
VLPSESANVGPSARRTDAMWWAECGVLATLALRTRDICRRRFLRVAQVESSLGSAQFRCTGFTTIMLVSRKAGEGEAKGV